MRSGVEPGSFELVADLGKSGLCLIRQRDTASIEESIDVVHPKANAFHVERPNRQSQRFAFFEDRVSRVALRLALNAGHQTLQALLGSFSMIGISHWTQR